MIPRVSLADLDDAELLCSLLRDAFAKSQNPEEYRRIHDLLQHCSTEAVRLRHFGQEIERCSFCNCLIGVESHAGGCSE